MTVCIAAACNDGENIVVAADRMVTAGIPLNLEFEPPLSKIEVLEQGCIALASGSLPFADQIITKIKTQTAAQPFSIDKVCEIAQQSYIALRNKIIDEQKVCAALGKDFQCFREKGASLPQYLQVQPNVYQGIFIESKNFNLGVELLIAGIDDNGIHIANIVHPGTLICLNKLGYAAVGSGATHALIALHLGGQAKSLKITQTLLSIYGAKYAAEVAPGVGKETDMAVISKDKIWNCTENLMNKIAEVHEQNSKKIITTGEEVEGVYESEIRTNC